MVNSSSVNSQEHVLNKKLEGQNMICDRIPEKKNNNFQSQTTVLLLVLLLLLVTKWNSAENVFYLCKTWQLR